MTEVANFSECRHNYKPGTLFVPERFQKVLNGIGTSTFDERVTVL